MGFFRKNRKRALALAMVFTMLTTLIPSDFALAEEMAEDSVKVVSENTDSKEDVEDLSSEATTEAASSETEAPVKDEADNLEKPTETTTEAVTTEQITEASTETSTSEADVTTEAASTETTTEVATTTETAVTDTQESTTEVSTEATTEQDSDKKKKKKKEMEEDEVMLYHHKYSGYTTSLTSKTANGYWKIDLTAKDKKTIRGLCYDHGKKMDSGYKCGMAQLKTSNTSSSKKAYFAAVAFWLLNNGYISHEVAIPLAWVEGTDGLGNSYYGDIYEYTEAAREVSQKLNGKSWTRKVKLGADKVYVNVPNKLFTKIADNQFKVSAAKTLGTSVSMTAKPNTGSTKLKAELNSDKTKIHITKANGDELTATEVLAMGGVSVHATFNIPGTCKSLSYLDFDTYYDKSSNTEWIQEIVCGVDSSSYSCDIKITSNDTAPGSLSFTALKSTPAGYTDEGLFMYSGGDAATRFAEEIFGGDVFDLDPEAYFAVFQDSNNPVANTTSATINFQEIEAPENCAKDNRVYTIKITYTGLNAAGEKQYTASYVPNGLESTQLLQDATTGAYYIDTMSSTPLDYKKYSIVDGKHVANIAISAATIPGFKNNWQLGGFHFEKEYVSWHYDSATQQFVSSYVDGVGVTFNLYAAKDIYYPGTNEVAIKADGKPITTDCYGSTLGLTTDNSGRISCDRLLPGSYYLVEDQNSVNVVGSTTDVDKKVFEVVAGANTPISSDDAIKVGEVYNATSKVAVSLRKEEPDTKPVAGAEFTLYAYVNNPTGNKVDAAPMFTTADAVSAMVGVKNGEPQMSAPVWVPIAKTTSADYAEGYNVFFNMKLPIGYYLIAETGLPDGYTYGDYEDYTYSFNLGVQFGDGYIYANTLSQLNPNNSANLAGCVDVAAPHPTVEANKVNAVGQVPANFSNVPAIINEPATFEIQLYKTGEMITGAENVSTPYGVYKRITFTEDLAFPGVTFELWQNGVLVASQTTDAEGYASFKVDINGKDLKAGTYLLKEVNNGGSYYTPWGETGKTVVLKSEGNEKEVIDVQDWENEYVNTKITLKKKGEVATPMVDTDADSTDFTVESDEETKVDEDTTTLLKKYKVYDKSETVLEGAVFALYTAEDITSYNETVLIKKDSCVGIAVSDADGNVEFSDKLKKGNYYLKEIKTSSNLYILPTESYPVEINPQNNDVEVNVGEVYNELYAGSITIVKVDAKNGDVRLPGVVFNLLDSNKKVLGTFVTNEQGQITITDLPIGKYYVQEVDNSAIDDYILDNEEYAVYVTADNLYRVKTIANARMSGKIKVIKVDADNHEHVLAGVSFELLDENNNILGSYVTGADGTLTTEELAFGKYYLRETQTQQGYMLDDTVHEINLTSEERFPELTIYNTAYKGSIKVIKTNGDKTIYLKGVVFKLYDSNKNVLGTYTTDENGEIFISGLRCGTYYIQETVTNKGYTLDDSLFQIDLTETNLDQILELVNEEETLKVVDEEDLSAEEDDGSSVQTGSNALFVLFILMMGFVVAGVCLNYSDVQPMIASVSEESKTAPPMKHSVEELDNLGKSSGNKQTKRDSRTRKRSRKRE